jgi:hypothetical protein
MRLSRISNLRMQAVSAAVGILPAVQPKVKGLQHWIVSARYQRAHVEHRADLRAIVQAPAEDCLV